MPSPAPEHLSQVIGTLYRTESGRVLATLVRLLGDLDLAEESMHEAFAAALESWTQNACSTRASNTTIIFAPTDTGPVEKCFRDRRPS
jgi:predicted RNA polymerase sigma factor